MGEFVVLVGEGHATEPWTVAKQGRKTSVSPCRDRVQCGGHCRSGDEQPRKHGEYCSGQDVVAGGQFRDGASRPSPQSGSVCHDMEKLSSIEPCIAGANLEFVACGNLLDHGRPYRNPLLIS